MSLSTLSPHAQSVSRRKLSVSAAFTPPSKTRTDQSKDQSSQTRAKTRTDQSKDQSKTREPPEVIPALVLAWSLALVCVLVFALSDGFRASGEPEQRDNRMTARIRGLSIGTLSHMKPLAAPSSTRLLSVSSTCQERDSSPRTSFNKRPRGSDQKDKGWSTL
ncbi:hypothetical protein WMY93_030650 [Mugilogobius chulae]|uniref:Uncharacterized protein n=1 Tax=Mugilogobius chulae TaxID=88201 RepID=A0AAW0MPZ8_9GOBI